jgi:hypothetical protein
MNSSSTTGEKFVLNVLKGIWCVVVTPVLIVGGILVAPVYGLIRSIDAVDDCVTISKHKRRINKDWRYRLNHQAIRMGALKIWQKDINAYDQHVRKMLAIAEINDLPLEVWYDLLYANESTDFQNGRIYEIGQMFGIPELYTNDVTKEAVEIAMSHYRQMYQELHAIPDAKDVELKIADIITRELFHHTDLSGNGENRKTK